MASARRSAFGKLGLKLRYGAWRRRCAFLKSAFEKTVPKIVPSARLYTLSSTLGQSAETRIFTIESELIQTTLKC